MNHKHRLRGLTALAASICTMLALAASASGYTLPDSFNSDSASGSQSSAASASGYTLPDSFNSDSASGSQSSAGTLPSSFRSDSGSNNPAPARPSHTLPSDFRSDSASPTSAPASSPSPTVIERIVEEENAQTLAIVLSSLALLIALLAAGSMIAGSIQRRHAGDAA